MLTNNKSFIFSRWFERLTMTVILFNCVTLGMFQPCEDNDCDNQRCRILKVRKIPGFFLRFAKFENINLFFADL